MLPSVMRILGAALLGLAVLGGCNVSSEPASARAAGQGAKLIPLAVTGAKGTHHFQVEVARTEAEQARGLMFRPSLAPDRGMIFPFPAPRPASFWMKNTMIPLDIIFIRQDGTIARIAAMATPYSLDPIEVGEPVAAVLEIGGGRAEQLGIVEGDTVHW
ncbi:DUF192 domain-containing protein [Flavisphingomonas formosensis]|uniref:DUF192 domain-containing protein n=1 Tax=Flavisphingomonas formosensis TaxID=861534 RepID=UPI0012FB571E|nr:DUF192 domain-containing protein [Sphingomonas formosensis]